MKHINLVYFVFAAFIIGFSSLMLIQDEGKPMTNIIILLIGLYFLYRGVAVTVNAKRRREREELDNSRDPENA